jgi:IS1 family transposase
MNRLSTAKRAQIVGALVEGNSIRATGRMAGVSKDTVTKLLVDLGAACNAFQDRELRNLPCSNLQVDEIWNFCYAKQRNVPEEHRDTFGYGDVWTWVAIDADTKLVPTWLVGERTGDDCWAFLEDLEGRLSGRIQLSTDAFVAYRSTVGLVFGPSEIDWATIMKEYHAEPLGERRYSPPVCTGVKRRRQLGDPDMDKVSTSYVERQNLTMRMGMRRFTRLTNAFSKKVENLAHAVSVHYAHYNFCRVHSSLTLTLDNGRRLKRTPAMAAGIADHVWSLEELVGVLENQESN